MKKVVTIIILLVFANCAYSQTVSDYLITNNIGSYKKITKGGPSGNILAGADHFSFDHRDAAYGISYVNDETKMWVDVHVTQHTGVDSDKWLLHEVEDGYRDNDDDDGRLGLLSGAGVKIREVDGNKIFYWGLGGGSYSWISGGSKVIEIKYVDLQRTKPEPLEVIRSYLAKHSSSITFSDADLKSKAHDEQWIKDEMDRRLWLCDKWFEQLQLGKVEQGEVLQEAVKSMNVFLDYREKYYGMKAVDEKNTLQGYLDAKDETNIKNKLAEYKTWWSANKSGSLIGILSVYAHNTYRYISNFVKKLFSFVTSLLERLLAVFG